MNKELIIFGPNGNLGKVVTDTLLNKKYDKYFIFSRGNQEIISKENAYQYKVGDLNLEENVRKAFNIIEPNKNSAYFLVSTIGGFINTGSIRDTKVDDIKLMWNLNFLISFLISKYYLKLIEQTLGGSICFISAFSSLRIIKNNFAYNLSKRALNNLIEYMAEEGKSSNFSVNGIAPSTLENRNDTSGNSQKSEIVNLLEVGELVHSIFDQYKTLSGNLFKLPGDIKFSE